MSGFILLKVLNIPVNPSKAGYLNSGNSLWHNVSIVMPSYRWVAYYLIEVENGIVIGFYDWQIIFFNCRQSN